MDLITFSTLFPNAAQPAHGLFVEARLRELRRRHHVSASVVAPVPWFPLRGERFGIYGRFASAPRFERRDGVDVHHPRYPLIPKVGMNLAPRGLALGASRCVASLVAKSAVTPTLDAHYFYPDGVAAAMLAGRHRLPLVISARGSDINLIAQFPAARRKILWAAGQADALVAVSSALADRMAELGMDERKIHVIRNGVDLDRFAPRDRDAERARLDLRGPVWLSVGNLVPLKGHELVIEALAGFPGATLIIAGEGPLDGVLRARAAALGLTENVRFVGSVKQNDLVGFYNAADVLVLASSREGMANVLLESLACATPVVATPVGGNPEVVADPAAGRLTGERSAAAIAAGVRELLADPPARAATRAWAEAFSWSESAARLHALLADIGASIEATGTDGG